LLLLCGGHWWLLLLLLLCGGHWWLLLLLLCGGHWWLLLLLLLLLQWELATAACLSRASGVCTSTGACSCILSSMSSTTAVHAGCTLMQLQQGSTKLLL
jgi:hypothetical protein